MRDHGPARPPLAAPAAIVTSPATSSSVLPAPLTPLIGRVHERAALAALFTTGAARLVTLLGTAGVGKTHLALQVAHDLEAAFADGVRFVDLTPLDVPDLVLSALADALGVQEVGYADTEAALLAALRPCRMLLVLDNFEQVREAAPLLARLLAAAPGLQVLTTSRVALRLRAEQLFVLAPLAVPDLSRLLPLDLLAQIESLALLLARLRAVVPELTLTPSNALALSAICVRVDGLPLALELVAARGRLLSPQELLAEVTQRFLQLRQRGNDVPPRHRKLTTALAWSYEQLPPTAMALFARLSIFPGTWESEAAVAVCDLNDLGRAAIFEGLELLLDHSLLYQQSGAGRMRLGLLATVRAFAAAALSERRELPQLQERLMSYCLGLAEQARQEMAYGPGLADWITRLTAESELMRAALDHALTDRDVVRGLRLASALRVFWYTRGRLREGRDWLERFLRLATTDGLRSAPVLYATVLDDVALLAWRQGDYRQAEQWGEQALGLYREAGNVLGEARVLMHLGLFAFDLGATEQARTCYEASLPIYRSLGNQADAVAVMHNLANLYNHLNDAERAMPLYDECLSFYERTEDRSGVELISLGMGAIYRDQGDPTRATAAFERSLALAGELGDDWSAAVAELNLGDLATDQGDYQAARLRLGEALVQFERIGDQQMISTTQGRLGDLELLAGDVKAAIGQFRQCLMLASAIEYQHGVAAGLEGLAGCTAVDQPLLAARLLGCAATIRAATNVPIPLADQPRYERIVQLSRSHSEPEAWSMAWEAGRALSLVRGVALALSSVRA
jgi:predicted ATPase